MTYTGGAAQAAERTLLSSSLLAMAALAAGLFLTNPAHAAGSTSGAEKVRRLDIMLMVTGLRCRTTPDDFQADYERFSANHLTELNRANAELRSALAVRLGNAAAVRELDRLSTTMANAYGQGHPWLNCADLKMATRDLAEARGEGVLEEAADQLLAGERGPQMAYAHR